MTAAIRGAIAELVLAEQHVTKARKKLADLVGLVSPACAGAGEAAAVAMTPEQMQVPGGFGGLLKRLRCERRLTTSDIWDRLAPERSLNVNALLNAERAVACTLDLKLAGAVLNVLAGEQPLTHEEARDWALMTGESLAVVIVHGCAGTGRQRKAANGAEGANGAKERRA